MDRYPLSVVLVNPDFGVNDLAVNNWLTSSLRFKLFSGGRGILPVADRYSCSVVLLNPELAVLLDDCALSMLSFEVWVGGDVTDPYTSLLTWVVSV